MIFAISSKLKRDERAQPDLVVDDALLIHERGTERERGEIEGKAHQFTPGWYSRVASTIRKGTGSLTVTWSTRFRAWPRRVQNTRVL